MLSFSLHFGSLSLSPSGPDCAVAEAGLFKAMALPFGLGSTCALEVLILILNGLDTKTNKLSSAHQAGLKNYGNGEGYAIIAANLRSQN